MEAYEKGGMGKRGEKIYIIIIMKLLVLLF